MNLNMIDISNTIGDMIEKDSSKQIMTVFKEAFNEQDTIELFKLRCLFIMNIDLVMLNTSNKYLYESFRQIQSAISYPNTTSPISTIKDLFSSSHIGNIEQAFQKKTFYEEPEFVDDLFNLNNDLEELFKNENITEEEKEIVIEIINAIENTKSEYEKTGNSAITKLSKNIVKIYDKLTKIESSIIKEQTINILVKAEYSIKVIKIFEQFFSYGNKAIEFCSKLS